MPSIPHEGLVEIVRQHPLVAVEILRYVGTFELPAEVVAVLGSEDMSAVPPRSNEKTRHGKPKPGKYTADSVVVVSDPATGDRLLAIIIEPQGEAEDGKEMSWPVYVTTARKANRCPRAVLIGACWDLAEARKCRKPIEIGHPGFVMTPLIVDALTPFNLAVGSPYLTLFSAVLGGVDMETRKGSLLVVEAIANTEASEAGRRSLADIILGVASDAAREHLEELMSVTYRDPFIESWISKGEAQGEAKGKAEGQIEDRRDAVLAIAEERGLTLSEAQRQRIADCVDLAQLKRWFKAAITAKDADGLFA